jgi:hypothetical protein
VESSCEFGIEPSGSINCWETIECPNNWGSLELELASVCVCVCVSVNVNVCVCVCVCVCV